MRSNLTGSYSSRMLNKSSLQRDSDLNKENKEINRRPSAKGKNVIQELAYSSKLSHPYCRHQSSSHSISQTIENTLIYEESSSSNPSKEDSMESKKMQSVKLFEQAVRMFQPVVNARGRDCVDGSHLKEIQQVRKEVDLMKQQVEAKDEELNSFKQMYQSQMNNINLDISHRISKDQHEKNTLIRQIHNKNIEITKLKDSYHLLESEKEGLGIYLREKESQIQGLGREIEEVKEEKKELEFYLNNIAESKNLLKEVEDKFEVLVMENKGKARQIEQDRGSIQQLGIEVSHLKERNQELQKEIKKYQGRENISLADFETELKRSRESIIKLNKELLRVPQLEMKLKDSQASCAQYKHRISQLLQHNDRMNVQLVNGSSTERKIGDLEWQLSQLKKTLLDTEGELTKVREDFEGEKQDDMVSRINRQLKQMTQFVDAQSKQISQLRSLMQDNQNDILHKEREVEKLSDEVEKLRERTSSMDDLFRENRRLTSLLKEKISSIQKLEMESNQQTHQLKIVGQQYTERELESERIVHHVRELEGRCMSLEDTLHGIKEQKDDAVERCESLEAQVVNSNDQLEKARLETAALSEGKDRLQKGLGLLDLKLEAIKDEKCLLEITIQQERHRSNTAQTTITQLNHNITRLHSNINQLQQDIQRSTSQILRLQQEAQFTSAALNTKGSENQRLSHWKDLSLSYLTKYQEIANEAKNLNENKE